MVFLIPFAGWATGAGLGALFGHLRDKGIDHAFQRQVRDSVQPGTSALFMVIDHATPDKAIAALQQYGGTMIKDHAFRRGHQKAAGSPTARAAGGTGS